MHFNSSEMVLDAVMTNVKTRAVFGGLRRDDALEMVAEMFVDQLDLKGNYTGGVGMKV